MPVGLIFAGAVGGLASHLIKYGTSLGRDYQSEEVGQAIESKDINNLNKFPKDNDLINSLEQNIVNERKNKEDRDFIMKFVDENLSKDLIESFYSEVILNRDYYGDYGNKFRYNVMTEVLNHLRSYRCSFSESLYKNLLDKIENKIMKQIPQGFMRGVKLINPATWKEEVKKSLWEDLPKKPYLDIDNYHTDKECNLIDDPLYKAFKSILAIYNLKIKDIEPKMSTQDVIS